VIRRFLTFAVACGCLFGCKSGSSGAPLPQLANPPLVENANPRELPEPPVVTAVNGVASVRLKVDENPATGEPEFVYERMRNVAPTIEVKPGDTIVLRISDDLPIVPPPAVGAPTEDMNLHFHGLGVSPRKPGDDVLTMLATPGETLHYVVHIPPTQEPGLYWYHPHVHGVTNYQVGEAGMSGALVIMGLERHLRGLGKMKQRIIIVRDTGVDDDALRARRNGSNTPCGPDPGLTVSLNGAVAPVISIAPGEKQFFRLINATGHKMLKLTVDGEELELVAIDGFALDAYPGTPPTLIESSIVVPPASRAEFVVTGPASGHARFRTLCFNSGPDGDPDPETLLARLEAPPHGAGADRSSQPLSVASPLPRDAYTTALPPIAAHRLVVLSENAKHFLINGKVFKMDAPPMFVVHVRTIEEWRVENVTGEVHDFHIHQLHFFVESINGLKVAHPHWADSVIVPHATTVGKKKVPGVLMLIMDFRNPVIRGEFVFHCHILDHEDKGMMAKIQAI
jgi:suppressor of ftsI